MCTVPAEYYKLLRKAIKKDKINGETYQAHRPENSIF
jgi:hypothetical protein